eukprot:gene12074-8626_t
MSAKAPIIDLVNDDDHDDGHGHGHGGSGSGNSNGSEPMRAPRHASSTTGAAAADVVSLLDDDVVRNVLPVLTTDLPRSAPHYRQFLEVHDVLQRLLAGVFLPLEATWLYRDAAEVARPLLRARSARHAGLVYTLRLELPRDFPASPPRVDVLCPLPGLEFCVVSQLPALARRLWSSDTRLADVFNTFLRRLEQSPAVAQAAALPATGPLLAQTNYASGDTLEQLVAQLYGRFAFELRGAARSVDRLVDALVPPDLCVCLGAVSAQAAPSRGGKGTGYSSGAEPPATGAAQAAAPAGGNAQTLLQAIGTAVGAALPTKAAAHVTPRGRGAAAAAAAAATAPQATPEAQRLLWLLQAPLPELLALVLGEFSREEMYRRAEAVGVVAALALRLDWLWQLQPPGERRDEAAAALRRVFAKLRGAQRDELFDAPPKWLRDAAAQAALFADSDAPSDGAADGRDGGGGGGGDAAAAAAPGAPRCGRVVFVGGLHEAHALAREAGACPKSWLRELRVLGDHLPEEVTLLVSEEQPQCLVALLAPANADCPYFGGVFVFHVLIPPRYPQAPPAVRLVTTDGGRVRFNPNLYACGKVCLSLLGTWSGEPWDPRTSNVTQVLASLLYLVFVEEPYYNEPGYRRPAAGQRDVAAERYGAAVLQNTLRVAALGHLAAAEARGAQAAVQRAVWQFYVDHWRGDDDAATAAATVATADGRVVTLLDADDAAVDAARAGRKRKAAAPTPPRRRAAAERQALRRLLEQIDAAVAAKAALLSAQPAPKRAKDDAA